MDGQSLRVFDQARERFCADIAAADEAGSYVDPVDIVVGMGLHTDVSDLVPAVVVLKSHPKNVKVSDEIPPTDVHVVGVDPSGDLGVFPFVQLQGVKVGVTD